MLAGENLGLVTVRKIPPVASPTYFAATRSTIINGAIRSDNQSIDYLFALYVYPFPRKGTHSQNCLPIEGSEAAVGENSRRPNLNPQFVGALERAVNRSFVATGRESHGDSLAAEDVFSYLYCVFHSQGYRSRYAELLRGDFPRLPLTSDKELFTALVQKGAELVSLHLMESPKLANFITRYEQPGGHMVEKVRYSEPNPKAAIKAGRVYINGAQYFDGAPKEVWEFQIGGYQVCEKWLKDRKGRKLSSDDIDHYQKIVVALNETIRLMREIDEIIPGWPLP